MLWNYNDHDDIILQIEEENRPIYDTNLIIGNKTLDKDNKNYFKRNANYIIWKRKILKENEENKKKRT